MKTKVSKNIVEEVRHILDAIPRQDKARKECRIIEAAKFARSVLRAKGGHSAAERDEAVRRLSEAIGDELPATANQIIVSELAERVFDIEAPAIKRDGHLRFEGGDWQLDIFTSDVPGIKKAFIDSVTVAGDTTAPNWAQVFAELFETTH